MAMQAAGYVALRAIGPRYGLLVVGLLGRFVSSTATIGIMGARSVREPQLRRGATRRRHIAAYGARATPTGGSG